MKMKEVMDLYHVSRKALLIYEEKRFISPQRNSSGYREYSERDIEIIKKIVLLRKLEFSLEEVEEIVINNHIEILQEKKEMYEKEKHLIDTKKSYLNYVEDVFNNESDIDEAIDAVEETMELYKNDQYNSIIQIEFNRDVIGVVWFGSLLIAILSDQLYLIIISLIFGLLSVLLCITSIRKKLMLLPYKPILGALLFIGGIVGNIYFISLEDTFAHCMMSGFCVFAVLYSLSMFKRLKEFFNKYHNILSFLATLIGIALFVISLLLELEGVFGYFTFIVSISLISLGIRYNQIIRDIVKGIFYSFI